MSATEHLTKGAVRERGSAKLLTAWKNRALTEDAIGELAKGLDQSGAKVSNVHVAGGKDATGVALSLSYEGDDVPFCGNGINLWATILKHHGGPVHIPRVIVNGTPYPDLIRVDLRFGDIAQPRVNPAEIGGQFAGPEALHG